MAYNGWWILTRKTNEQRDKKMQLLSKTAIAKAWIGGSTIGNRISGVDSWQTEVIHLRKNEVFLNKGSLKYPALIFYTCVFEEKANLSSL
jgi:hypothetical protein